MKCHDGEECKHGCTDDRMLCAMPVPIVDELRMPGMLTEKRCLVIANYVERIERELAAYEHVMDILRDSPCKYPPWRDAREVVEWIERRVDVLLAANAQAKAP